MNEFVPLRKTQEPDVDYGFRAIIPRIVRTEYKHITPIQKWLYTCLKDLCGDRGTCYRTMMVLAEETGISTGLISESIPVLHDAGLIHAEKKKRSSGGKPVWHITIIDIWQANALAHPTKRSPREQTTENVHHVNENVHHVNENVHHVNENSLERSRGELERSQIPHRSNNHRSITSNEVGRDEAYSDNAFASVTDASANTTPLSLSQESEQVVVEVVTTPQGEQPSPLLEKEKERKPRRSRAVKSASATSLLDTLDEDMRARVLRVYETFDTLKRETMENPLVRYGRTDESTQHIQSLIENESPTEEGLRHVYLKMWETPKDVRSGFYWREHMDIKNVCKQYPKLIMTMPKKKAPVVASTTVVNADGAGNTTPMVEVDLEQFITPTMRRLRAREAAWLASTQQTAQKGQEHA